MKSVEDALVQKRWRKKMKGAAG